MPSFTDMRCFNLQVPAYEYVASIQRTWMIIHSRISLPKFALHHRSHLPLP